VGGERRHHHAHLLARAVRELLDAVRDATSRQHAHALDRDGWTCAVTEKPLATEVVVGVDANARMRL
jgi:hypothetical protein